MSTSFQQQRDQIIQDALAMVGAIGPNKTPTGDQIAHAARALNAIAKELDSESMFLWRVARRTATTTLGTATYTLGTDVIDIDQPVRYTRAGATAATILFAMGRPDYMSLPDRTIRGLPTTYWVELPSGATGARTITFWPTPDATSDTFEYAAVIRANDFNVGTDTPDFDQKFTQGLILGTASRIAYAYFQPALALQLTGQYELEKARLIQDTGERGGLRIVAFGGW